jgi:L-iditol 2-dehydrogenase/threonine 3-dehydrogenase
MITDISNFRLDIAKACGIEEVLNVKQTPFAEGIQKSFGEEGFQVGMEAAGVQESLDVLMANVEKGGDVVVLGVYAKDPTVNMFHLGEHELNVFGSMMYKHEDYLAAVEMIETGKINLDPLISKHFPFDEYLQGYKYIEEKGNKSMKVIIDL